MAGIKDILPDKRRTTVLAALIFLLVIFLVPYFFVFIPANADSLRRQAFLKLSRSAENIIDKSTDTHNFYQTSNSGVVVADSVLQTAECRTREKQQISYLDSVYFMFNGSGWNIIYVHDRGAAKGTLVNTLPLQSFIDPCVASGKEIFSSFLIIHYCPRIGSDSIGKIIYQDPGEGMEQEINLDSLIPRHQGMRSPDMNDITLKGTDYKLFTYPFQLGRHRLELCGLMTTDYYNAQLHQIPVGTMYTLVICLVLFLLSLPFLKIFMMNERDRIYAINLVVGILSLFAMASFITIISTQLILLQQGRLQVQANLDSVSVKIEDSLSAELTRGEHQLKYLDTQLNDFMYHPNLTALSPNGEDTAAFIITRDRRFNKGDTVFEKNDRVMYGHAPVYHNSDHCGWISPEGKESVRIRWLPDGKAVAVRAMPKDSLDSVSFVDVRARQYYQTLAAQYPYKTPQDSTLILAPVQSWASGEFRVNICRYSAVPGLMIELMETRLSSLVNTVLPAGYGYCLFTDSGSVLIHSDTLKSLRENFLDETGQLPWILSSVKGRQERTSGHTTFYGKDYTLRIQPLRQHPLFLAVFYNNDFLEPVNLRILTFSLFFCLLTYALLVLLFRMLNPSDPRTHLFTAIDYDRRMIPRSDKLQLYFNGSLMMVVYILFFTLASVFSPWIDYDTDYTVLVFGLLTSFNLCYGLMLLQRKAGLCDTKKKIIKAVSPAAGMAVVVLVVSILAGWPLNWASFALMEIALCWGFAQIVKKKKPGGIPLRKRIPEILRKITGWDERTPEDKKVFAYSWFITLFIFAISVLPALEYSWFAYSHEQRQSIKKQQLEIAEGLQRREKNIRSFLHTNQPDFSGNDANYKRIQYQEGIYMVHPGIIMPVADWSQGKRRQGDHDSRAETFYLSIASTINLFYKDPSGLPPLYDSSIADNLWHWNLSRDSCELDYSRPKWMIPPLLSDGRSSKINFKITTALPGGLQINLSLQLAFAGLLTGLLLAIYWITRTIARQVYLTRIVGDAGNGINTRFGKCDHSIWQTCRYENGYADSVGAFLRGLEKEYAELETRKSDLIKFESEIVCKSRDFNKEFECVWKTLNDKEKYLLYCLASDGLLNHKNEAAIYGLLNKNLLIIYDQRVRLLSYSFREFILSRSNSKEEIALLAKMQSGASWAYLRTIVLVIIGSAFIFLFLTQQQVSAKIIALITSLSALLPFILKFGSSGAGSAGASDSKN